MTPETQATPTVKYITLPAEYAAQRAKGIGMVAPFDFALDDECRRWLPSDVSLYVTRTARLEDTAVTEDLAREVGSVDAVIPGVRSLISAEPAAVVYACTSGSFINGLEGEKNLREAMESAGALSAVTTSGALITALRELGITRLAIATPYNQPLTRALADFLETANINVVKAGYLDSESNIMHITYDSVRSMAKAVDCKEAQAIFFSCTNLHTFDIISELEAELGKPILSANQVMMWAALKAANLPMPEVGQQLFNPLHTNTDPLIASIV